MVMSGIHVFKILLTCSVTFCCFQILYFFWFSRRTYQTYYKYDNVAGTKQKALHFNTTTERPGSSSEYSFNEMSPEIEQFIKQTDDFSGFCQPHSYSFAKTLFKDVHSNISEWSFSKLVNCPRLRFPESAQNSSRLKFILSCKSEKARVRLKLTNSSKDVFVSGPQSQCLSIFIRQCCKDELLVPNVVHYVWYCKHIFGFFHFVSFIGVIRFVRPCAILLHGNRLPEGKYWDFILKVYPNIIHVKQRLPTQLFGKEIGFVEHIGDVMRIEALLRYGGIYLDMDTLIVRPVDELRKYPYTMSRQTENRTISSSFIMAERNATFLQQWLEWYNVYYVNDSYTYNAMMYPNFLAGRKPSLIHVEFGTISRPEGQVKNTIFTSNYDWSKCYGMHLFARAFKQKLDENNIRDFNTTVGSMVRHILFGDKEVCED